MCAYERGFIREILTHMQQVNFTNRTKNNVQNKQTKLP